MALHLATSHPDKFAGVIALSCYLPLAPDPARLRNGANLRTPIYMAHGTQDPVVPFALGDDSRQLLTSAGYNVDWHAYPMPHSLCAEEVQVIAEFLTEAFGEPAEGAARRSSILLP